MSNDHRVLQSTRHSRLTRSELTGDGPLVTGFKEAVWIIEK